MADNLPQRFPCWCRAVYSWGGETKRDLGFIEGDLIECLNAGDGSWWMGRLKRDRRMIGLFPSNFVEVLDESFQPQNKISSQTPYKYADNPGSNALNKSGPSKPKSKFRKPFQAYYAAGSPNSDASKKEASKLLSSNLKSASTGTLRRTPFASMKVNNSKESSASPARPSVTKEQSDNIIQARSSRSRRRSRSPLPPVHNPLHNSATLNLAQSRASSRAPSPTTVDMEGSPPPPPPPPHRVIYNHSRQPSPIDTGRGKSATNNAPQSRSPISSNSGDRRTPSPLRDAMNEVMTSLKGMSVDKEDPAASEHGKPTIWSPEAYDQLYAQPSENTYSQGDWTDDERKVIKYRAQDLDNVRTSYRESSDYAERMEDQLRDVDDGGCLSRDHPGINPETLPPSAGSQLPTIGPDHSYHADILPELKSRQLRNRRSAFEVGKDVLSRTFTTKSTITSASSAAQSSSTSSSGTTQMTSQSLMSGYSAGGFSATSAGSFARRKFGAESGMGRPTSAMNSPIKGLGNYDDNYSDSPISGVTYHSSHDSHVNFNALSSAASDNSNPLGGLSSPKPKKSGFFKKMIESAKTGAASARSTVGTSPTRPQSRYANSNSGRMSAMSSHAVFSKEASGNAAGGDWVQVRRDVNRSNSLSRNERSERADRLQLNDMPVIFPVDELFELAEGDEGSDGFPINEPMNFSGVNFALVDKSSRFTNALPPLIKPAVLAQGYLCRPYRSDVQRLRAIYTWLSERISWEDDFEGEVDLNRVLQAKRACSREISTLVVELCAAIGIHAETVRGYLKAPGEILDFEMMARPNHWWNAIIVDGEWRIMDCSLASPTNPRRSEYSCAGQHVAEGWWFLARPMEVCYTHIPLLPEQQHICPQLPHEVLMALPCACPPYFRHSLQLYDFDTSLLYLDGLEMAHIQFLVPDDIECVAEVEARTFQQDIDGDYFENGDLTIKKALAQAEWIEGRKKYTVKALLPGDEGQGVLKVYAGKRGLMHSINSNPHPLAFALPLLHNGANPPYEFLLRHPTPHALRYELYVAQPQCYRLALNNTFVFAIKQHPCSTLPLSSSSATGTLTNDPLRSPSPRPLSRPGSAMSMHSVSAAGSAFSNNSNGSNGSSPSQQQHQKGAKLAIQTPSGKIIRLTKKTEYVNGGDMASDGDTWETIVKVGEKGPWRGLVLADRSVRWCVFCEWECF